MSFYAFLFMGMAAMVICMAYTGKCYGIPVYKSILAAVLLTAIGYCGATLMFYIESQGWTGRSLYGAIFLAPILMFPVSIMLKTPYKNLIDLCAPAECIMLMVLKVKCMLDGCCGGRTFQFGNVSFVFPSQITEAVVFLVIGFVLFRIVLSKSQIGKVYPIFMVVYGTARFFLNLLRTTTPWIFGIAAGNVWSLVSVGVGLIVLLTLNKEKQSA